MSRQIPNCPICGKPMQNHSKPQQPLFICEDCCCNESGIEVHCCEGCGEWLDYDEDCDCGFYEEEECGNCGDMFYPSEGCPCKYGDKDEENDD